MEPTFDPKQPYTVEAEQPPVFDSSKPFEVESAAPSFDPSKPFEKEGGGVMGAAGRAWDWANSENFPTENTKGGKWFRSKAETYGQAIGKPLANALNTTGNTPLGLATVAAASIKALGIPFRIGAAFMGYGMAHEGAKRAWNANTGPERLQGAVEAGLGVLGLLGAAKGAPKTAPKASGLTLKDFRNWQKEQASKKNVGEVFADSETPAPQTAAVPEKPAAPAKSLLDEFNDWKATREVEASAGRIPELSAPEQPAKIPNYAAEMARVSPDEIYAGREVAGPPRGPEEIVLSRARPVTPSGEVVVRNPTVTPDGPTTPIIERINVPKQANFKGLLKRNGEQGHVITPTEAEIAAFAAKIGKAVKDLSASDMAMLRVALAANTIGKTGREEKRGVAENVNRMGVPEHSKLAILRNGEYESVNSRQIMRDVKELTDSELAAVTPGDYFYHASKVEQALRHEKAGRFTDADAALTELEQSATKMGQNNAFIKALYARSPRAYANKLNKTLIDAGADPLAKPQLQRLKELVDKANDTQDAFDFASAKWKKTRTPADLKAVQAADLARETAAAELSRRTVEMTPRKFWRTMKAVMQGNMLAPASLSANFVGNLSFFAGRAAGKSAATLTDVLDSSLTGHGRQITQAPVTSSAAFIKSLPAAVSHAWDIIKKGSGELQAKEGGQHGQALHPLDALKNLIVYSSGKMASVLPESGLKSRLKAGQAAVVESLPSVNGKLTVGQLADMAVQATLGMPAEVMLRALGATDAVSVGAVTARLVAQEAKLRVKNGKPMPYAPEEFSMAVKFPEMFFDAATAKRIREGASSAVFQQQSGVVRHINSWIAGKGAFADFALATVAPYKLTPWNIMAEILSYAPGVSQVLTSKAAIGAKSLYAKARQAEAMGRKAEAKQLFEKAEGKRREAKLNAGKMIVGTTMAGGAWYLYEKGVISPAYDTSDEAVKVKIQAGTIMPPNSINWSALDRVLKGQSAKPQKGDYITDYFRAGGLTGSFLYMMSNIGRDIEKSRGDSESLIKSVLTDSVPEMARFGVTQSFLKGVSGLLESIRDGRGDQFIQNYISGVLSIPLPNTLSAISRAMRPYKPDLKPEKWQDYFAHAYQNRMGFTGLDAYMPLKLDVWGRPMRETPQGRNPYVYHMVDVFKMMRTADSPLDLEVYRLARTTGDSSAVPSIPTPKFTFAGKEYNLNRQQYQEFATLVGQYRRNYGEALVTNPEFHKMPDKMKLLFLNRFYDAGLKLGMVKFISKTPLQSLPVTQPKTGFQYDAATGNSVAPKTGETRGGFWFSSPMSPLNAPVYPLPISGR